MYTPERVILTGGAGFIGSHVLRFLVQKYPEVLWVCLDKLDYCASLKNLESLRDFKNFKFVKGDITSPDLVNYLLVSENIDTIMHFAAQSHVDNSFGNSFQFTHNNVMGTHVLLEASKVNKIKRFIHVSTDEVYGESKDEEKFYEGSMLNPTNPYASSKACAELLVRAYMTSFGLPCIITRGNNVFGPNQYPEKLIPKFISLLESEKPCCLHGDGTNQRSFIYIDDVVRAFDTVLMYGVVGETYNIGTEFEITNLDVAKTLLDEYGFNYKKFIEFTKDRAFNDKRYHIDNTKLQKFGWYPMVDFIEGLRKTILWYKENPSYFGDIKNILVPHPNI